MYKLIILFIHFVFFSSGNLMSQVNTGKKETIWKTHYDSVYNFSFQYPGDWEFKLPNAKSRFFVTSYKENEVDSFRENVNCIARVLDQKGFVIRDAEMAIKNSLSEKLADYKLISSEYIKWNNVDALQIKYSYLGQSGNQKFHLTMFQQMAFVKGVLITLTFTSTTDSYNKYVKAVNKMYSSFIVQ